MLTLPHIRVDYSLIYNVYILSQKFPYVKRKHEKFKIAGKKQSFLFFDKSKINPQILNPCGINTQNLRASFLASLFYKKRKQRPRAPSRPPLRKNTRLGFSKPCELYEINFTFLLGSREVRGFEEADALSFCGYWL